MREFSRPVYSVIIPAYNEATELPATMKAVREAMHEQFVPGEIIVVDNNSSDHTAGVARAHGANRVVFESVNQISRARNAGAAVARGLYFVFVDADTRIDAALLTRSLELLETDHVGGGAVIHFEGPIGAVGKLGISLWERISKMTRIAAGSYLFCTRSAFDAVGGFDERLYASEEVRLSRLIKKWGKSCDLRFSIIESPPARTSARKLKWYSGPQVLGWVALMVFFPLAVRWRKFCGFWYRRPDYADSSGSS